MSYFFYNLGKKMGPKVRKGQWIWQNLVGSQDNILQSEYDVGLDIADSVLQTVPICQDPAIVELVDSIGSRLCRTVSNKKRKFKFFVTEQDICNAFAVPGGFIFVTRSLVELCDRDKSQLAFILGHEMSHVIKGHAIERVMADMAASFALKRMPTRGAAQAWLKNKGLRLLQSAYSQQREFQADQLGVKIADAGLYDKNGAVKMLSSLADQQKDGNNGFDEYFSTHPCFSDRISCVKKTIATL